MENSSSPPLDLSPLIVCEVVCSACKLDEVLESLSFLQCLATTLHTNVTNLLLPLFLKPTLKLATGYKLQRRHCNESWRDNSKRRPSAATFGACCYEGHSLCTPESLNPQIRKFIKITLTQLSKDALSPTHRNICFKLIDLLFYSLCCSIHLLFY